MKAGVRGLIGAVEEGHRSVMVMDSVSASYRAFANRLPTISGKARIGHTLTAKSPWPAGATLSYQWYHYGLRINGATHRTYTLKKSDRGKRMRVKVRVSMPGYYPMERYSRLKVAH